MIIYRKAQKKPIRIFKAQQQTPEEKTKLQRIQEMLKKHQTAIIIALLLLWGDNEDDISESQVKNVIDKYDTPDMSTALDVISKPYHDRASDLNDDVLLPELSEVGKENIADVMTDTKNLINIPEDAPIIPSSVLAEPPKQLPMLSDEPVLLPEGNHFDYNVFYSQWCDTRAGELIKNLTDTQRKNIQTIVGDALKSEKYSIQEVANRIRDTVGLTEKQLQTNQKYYDTVRNGLKESNPSLSDKELDSRAAEAARKMADKQRSTRAKAIARSELNKAHNQSARAYIQWAVEHGYMKDVLRQWITSGNDNVCPVCASLNRQTIPLNGKYRAPDSVKSSVNEYDGPPGHTNCCCGERFFEGDGSDIPNVPSEWDKMSEAEKKAHINYYNDKEQYKAYKKRLGRENLPETLAEFQQMKYNNTEEYEELQERYRSKNPKFNLTSYAHNEAGHILSTHHRTIGSVPKTLRPYAVLDYEKKDGHIERTIYDKDGNMKKQIHPTNHGNPKQHPYGNNGEHAHIYKWEDGALIDRNTRDLTENERKEHGDIL